MRNFIFVTVLAAASLGAQTVDLSSVDKLAAKAKSYNIIGLDQNQLRAALAMMPPGKSDSPKNKVLSGLTSVIVRNLEFSERGQYSLSDLEPVRAQLAKLKGAVKIVDSREKDERSEIYMLMDGDKPNGLAIFNVEPKEINVVVLQGAINLSDLGSLGGVMGLPTMRMGPREDAKKQP
jgi:hypothetical protein